MGQNSIQACSVLKDKKGAGEMAQWVKYLLNSMRARVWLPGSHMRAGGEQEPCGMEAETGCSWSELPTRVAKIVSLRIS